MTKKEDLYPLTTKDEIRIEFRYERFGKLYRLVHVFREPTAEDKEKYWRHLSKTELRGRGKRSIGQTDYLGANKLLWGRCIKSVEGYDIPEGTVEWKGLIDPDHKRTAVEKLLEVTGSELDEDEQKN